MEEAEIRGAWATAAQTRPTVRKRLDELPDMRGDALPVAGAVTRMAQLEQPNGLAFAPDGQTLYVSDTLRTVGGDRHTIVAFDVVGGDGLANRRVFAEVEPGVSDGLRVDSRGWIWRSSEAGVQVLSSEGPRLGLIPTPQVCSNLCPGPGDRRLFVTSKHHLHALDLREIGPLAKT